MKQRKWIVREQDPEAIRCLCESLQISPIVSRLLYNRGLTDPERARLFLRKSIDILCDPFLLPDMRKAVNRINDALAHNERITIYGDYDVDGITSTSILYQYLSERTDNIDYYIPDRMEEGYGVNMAAIDTLAAAGTTLLITVDAGITALREIAHANDLGLTTIITDHHECAGGLPPAYAIVNPKRPDSEYPFPELAGVGVVFKLLCALSGREHLQDVIDRYSELVAFGTIADVMPLNGENRIIVSLGLKRLEHTRNIGLRALIAQSGIENKKITAGVIGYTLAPRVNAAGRVGSPRRAVKLLLSRDPREAAEIARELCDANRERQDEENKIITEAYDQLEHEPGFQRDKIIVLASDHWHHGIIGIVSSRLSDKYYLPSIMISFDGESGKGSGRSIPGFNIYEALAGQGELLEKFGGHALAAGLSLKRENYDAFKAGITRYANEILTDEILTPKLKIDCEIDIRDITLKTVNEILLLEPYGMGNAAPLFLLRDIRIDDICPISGDKHTKLLLSKNGVTIDAFLFGRGTADFPYFRGEKLDLVCNLDTNSYRGNITVQLVIKDLHLSSTYRESLREYTEALHLYQGAGCRGLTQHQLLHVIPSREDFVTVYRYLTTSDEIHDTLELLHRRIGVLSDRPPNICKLRICLDVFTQMDMLSVTEEPDGALTIRKLPVREKKNLDLSPLLIELKSIRGKNGS
ncbi:single-stranded-DNA-specific exonuclease RecJ [Feifania hominis]|uniref:Single-stranded-DNA-specific exonuclease RecJ n=1 Tax=Feifania hominis TaxID=2763660 RepID=A0A926DF98_9FIRM|nr:single-stranded-DNA-specific exonuclease RecJ [Feifania hominis]MBC8536767.1 single-stranded-DNA-specific exonuclease RecJ [Feifania hominis]